MQTSSLIAASQQSQLSIEEYLAMPHQHIWQMLVHLQSVQMYTAYQHEDYPFIDGLVNGLYSLIRSYIHQSFVQNMEF